MPTRIEVNVQTGEIAEIELQGEELAAYQASLANPQPVLTPEPSLAEIVAQLQAEIAALKGKQ